MSLLQLEILKSGPWRALSEENCHAPLKTRKYSFNMFLYKLICG